VLVAMTPEIPVSRMMSMMSMSWSSERSGAIFSSIGLGDGLAAFLA
jgi:hypothetical protein